MVRKVNRKYLGPVVLLLAATGLLYAHSFYVSICKIRYPEPDGPFEVSIRVFTDNLQEALQAETGINTYLNGPYEHIKSDSLITRYLNRHLHLIVRGDSLPLLFQEKAYIEDATEISLRTPSLSTPDSVILYNDVLTDQIDEQTNIVRIWFGDNKYFYNFSKIIRKESINLGR